MPRAGETADYLFCALVERTGLKFDGRLFGLGPSGGLSAPRLRRLFVIWERKRPLATRGSSPFRRTVIFAALNALGAFLPSLFEAT